jgi:uracil-DNA glycosylase family 4
MDIEQLKQEVNECKKCKDLMHCKDNNMLPAILEHDAKILFIPQNPGIPLTSEKNISYKDVLWNSRQGQSFIERFLENTNLVYEDICWHNICLCPSRNNRPVDDVEMANCKHFLQEHIDLMKNLKIIIILGIGPKFFLQTSKLKLKEGIKIIFFPHPAYLMRTGQWEKLDNLKKEVAEALNGR